MANGGLYRVGPFVAVASLLALLSGCGRFGVFEQRDPWRAEAELQCLRSGHLQTSWAIAQRSPISGPGVCGLDYPLRVEAFARGSVGLKNANVLSCPMVSEVDRWFSEVVQPAARNVYGSKVVEIRSGSYSCRSRNSQRGGRLSEHAFGNALDLFSFRLSDGREVAVKTGWRGPADEQMFLREVFAGACQHFKTVLGPGSDLYHYDHIHLDLARHDPRGLRTVCKPVIKYDPLPGEGRIDRPLLSYRPPAQSKGAVLAGGGSAPTPPAPIQGVSSGRTAVHPLPPTRSTAPFLPQAFHTASPPRVAGAPLNLTPPNLRPLPRRATSAVEELEEEYVADE